MREKPTIYNHYKLKLRLILYVSWPPISSFFLLHLIIHAFGTFQPFDAKPCLTLRNNTNFKFLFVPLGYSILHVTLIIKQRDICTVLLYMLMFSSDLPLHLGASVACALFCGCHCRLSLSFLVKEKMPFIIIIICDIT